MAWYSITPTTEPREYGTRAYKVKDGGTWGISGDLLIIADAEQHIFINMHEISCLFRGTTSRDVTIHFNNPNGDVFFKDKLEHTKQLSRMRRSVTQHMADASIHHNYPVGHNK